MDIFALALKIGSTGMAQAMQGLDKVDVKGKKTASSLSHMVTGVSKLWALAGTLATGTVAGALTMVIKAAGEAEQSISELEGAVENAGASFAAWSPVMEEAVSKLQMTTRFGDEAGRRALATLITTTNDVAASYKNLGLVADIAAKKHMDLNSAADLVGKVMAGNTGMLARYGIVVKEGENAMALLQSRFGGFAEKEGKTFFGQMAKIGNLFGEVLETIGSIIIGTKGTGGAMEGLIAILQKVQIWLEKHRERIQAVISALAMMASFIGKVWSIQMKIGMTLLRETSVLFVRVAEWIAKCVASFQWFIGIFLKGWGKIGEFVGGIIDKVFGTDLAEGASRMLATGDAWIEASKQRVEAIDDRAQSLVNTIRGLNAEIEKPAMVAPPAVPPPGKGKAPTPFVMPKLILGDGKLILPDVTKTVDGWYRDFSKVIADIRPLPITIIPKVEISGLTEAMMDSAVETQGAFESAFADTPQILGDVLGGLFEGGFKGAGKAAMAGLGGILTQLGGSLLKTGLIMKGLLPALSNPFTSGGAMIAAGALMLALGKAMGSTMTGRGGGGSGSARADTAPADTTTRVTMPFTNASRAADLEPRTQIGTVNIIGARDLGAQREVRELLNYADRRNI